MLERFKTYYQSPTNKVRLLKLLKKNGEYLSFNPKLGFIYCLQVGISNGIPVQIKVSMKSGMVKIIDVIIKSTRTTS
jgi:hypothetical protein